MFLSLSVFAQLNNEWELVSSSNSSTTYLNTKDVSSFKGGDIYVWVMEKYNFPIIIESVGGKIYKSKTYYLFSQEYLRYSMLQIIYYDEDDNVLKSFDYNRKTDIPAYKYNYPIMQGSTEEVIFQKLATKPAEQKKDNE